MWVRFSITTFIKRSIGSQTKFMRSSFLLLIAAVSFIVLTPDLTTAQSRTRPVAVPYKTARTEDVATLDGIIKAFYETVSGPAGQAREWGRDRTLYIEGI